MKKLLPILFLLAVFSSCKKKETRPDCEIKKYGTITVSNSSANPYDIYVDGVFKMRLNGNSISTKIQINEGNARLLHAKQVSGYLVYPTEVSGNFNVLSCSDYAWQIP